MSALQHFTNGQFELDIEPHPVDGFRVQAPGLAQALGFRESFDLVRNIPEGEKGSELVRTLGGEQNVTYLTEAGFYRALGMRQSARISDDMIRARVEAFQNWIYRDVLPSIRATGGYQVPEMSREELLARAVLESKTALEERDARIAELEPKAIVADRFLTADGDLAVADAAKALTRAGVKVGPQRLFALLDSMGWIYRNKGDNRWRVYQRVIESGHMSVIPMSHYHPKTGVLVLDPPQPRVTPKGMQRLLTAHGATQELVST